MPNHQQPFLHELVTTLAAPTQVLSGPNGDVTSSQHVSSAQGVIHADVRVLSEAVISVNGQSPVHIATTDAGDPSDHTDGTTFVSLIRALPVEVEVGADPQLRLDRRRVVTPGRVAETLTFSSTLDVPLQLSVTLALRADYASIESIKWGLTAEPQPLDLSRDGDTWSWSATDLQLRLIAPHAEVEQRDEQTRIELGWSVPVPALGQAAVEWALELVDRGAAVVAAQGRPLAVAELVESMLPVPFPTGGAADARLAPWLQRSLTDLNALRMATPDAPHDAFFAAGSPWYLTLFGRDSLWAARLLLPVDVNHAGSTLRTLAARQGVAVDVDSAEQPGKILHELRRGQFSFGQSSLPPVYFGTVDATLLWVCLLHDAWRAGLPEDEVRALLPALQAALGWLSEYADADGDGFVEYIDESGHGLANQGWKDSGDSIRFADGSIATGAVALVEVQGYAYEAARVGADLLEAFGLPGVDRHRRWAAELAERFRTSFWCGSGPDRYPALALDGAKRRVDSVTSNMGHLLGTGILDAEEERLVARRLAAPDMDSGLGLRTMSCDAGGYWPLSYHCGSVWPHDTAIVLAGLNRAGLLSEAAGLVEGLLQASLVFDGRLPELWSGEGTTGVPYPASCRPQAWSAAAAVTVAEVLGHGELLARG